MLSGLKVAIGLELVEQKRVWQCTKRAGTFEEALVQAELAAMASGNNFRVIQLKKEIDVLLDRKSTMWA